MNQKKLISLVTIIVAMMAITMVLSVMDEIGGDTELISSLIGGICVFAFVIALIFILFGTKKTGSQGKKRPTGTPSFRSNAKDHEHITMASIGHDKSHELQQLDTMLEAGLIDNKEYQERLERIRKQAQNQVQQKR